MKKPTYQQILNILFNRYGTGPIDIYKNKAEAQAFISRLIEVGMDANEEEEKKEVKEEWMKLFSKAHSLYAEKEFEWFWLSYGPKCTYKENSINNLQ